MIPESKTNNSEEFVLSKKSKLTFIAGILLILAGIIAIISMIPYAKADKEIVQFIYDNINTNMTQEQIKQGLSICGSIGIILSIFPILGGILVLKRKFWIISIFCSIIGLFMFWDLFISSILSFIALIILIIYKKDFQQVKKPFS